MKEIKVEEYVRTKNGRIYKLEDGTEFHENEVDIGLAIMPEIYGIWVDKNHFDYVDKKDIVKHSPNIIDLIEVDDYVNGKEVIGKFVENNEIVIIIDTKVLNTKVKENDIKSIVTKEQFISMEYEVNYEN